MIEEDFIWYFDALTRKKNSFFCVVIDLWDAKISVSVYNNEVCEQYAKKSHDKLAIRVSIFHVWNSNFESCVVLIWETSEKCRL